MELNHTIIWAADRKASVAFYAAIFGLEAQELFGGHFLAVRINDGLTFDFAQTSRKTAPQHYAFKVTEQEFDEVFSRLKERGLPYWSRPAMAEPDMKIYRHNGGRGVYFHDVDKNGLEILTANYDDTKPFE
jgi:catechol 2,3-dioxygenase-like lactoylglutathione lyase family enzyme